MRDVSSKAIADQDREVGIKLGEVDLKRGINKRDADRMQLLPRGMARRICFPWRQGMTFMSSCDEWGQVASIRTDRGDEVSLVLHRLLPWKEDGFVSGSEIETAFTIKALGPLIRFVYQQANGFGVFEQASHQF